MVRRPHPAIVGATVMTAPQVATCGAVVWGYGIVGARAAMRLEKARATLPPSVVAEASQGRSLRLSG